MKIGTNVQHMSGHYCKGFQGQRSQVNVIATAKCTFVEEAYISTAWRRGLLVS